MSDLSPASPSSGVQPSATTAICDYEGSRYRTDFWEGQGREFEDAAERIALRHLLPPRGRRLIEIGAGFGRLADLYASFEQVILLDYSRSLLQEARARLGDDSRFLYVAANVYALPLAPGAVDTTVMVRVAHHLADLPRALGELARVTCDGGVLVMEYANKRHLKSLLRYLARRQTWSPFAHAPYEFVPLNFDFHPAWMTQRLTEAGFQIEAERAVSHLRFSLFKRLVPARRLAQIDGWLQRPGAALKLAPSIFVRARRPGTMPAALPLAFFRCPTCGAQPLAPEARGVFCPSCSHLWPQRDGIYDFKAP